MALLSILSWKKSSRCHWRAGKNNGVDGCEIWNYGTKCWKFVKAVSNKNTHINVEGVSQTDIDEIKKCLQIRFNHLSAIPGTRIIHYLQILDEYVIQYTYLSTEQSVRMVIGFVIENKNSCVISVNIGRMLHLVFLQRMTNVCLYDPPMDYEYAIDIQ